MVQSVSDEFLFRCRFLRISWPCVSLSPSVPSVISVVNTFLGCDLRGHFLAHVQRGNSEGKRVEFYVR